MKVAVVPVTPFQQNCSILVDEETNKAAVVDPGGDLERILDAAKQTGTELEKTFLTHRHIDHCGGTSELRRITGLPVERSRIEDDFWISQLPLGYDTLMRSTTTQLWALAGGVDRCPQHRRAFSNRTRYLFS